MSVKAAAAVLLTALAGRALAADPTPVTTSQVVVSASPASVTFKASQVSDHSKYTQAGTVVVTANGQATTIYHDGFVWVPSPSVANPPAVPTQFVPTTGYGNTVIVTATTGTPPPVVTYTASQDTKMTSVTAKTTSSGTTIFPFGWIWVPVPPPGGVLPPTLPALPSDAVPPEATSNPSDNGCKTTTTPVVTVVLAYTTNAVGDFQTTTSTKKATEVGTCLATPTTTTSTASAPVLPTNDNPDADIVSAPLPTDFPPLDAGQQKVLNDAFSSLSLVATIAKPTLSCADNTYDKAIPSAAAFIHGLSPSFCADWSAKPTNALSKEYTAKNVKKRDLSMESSIIGKRMSLHEKRTPPPAPLTQDSYPGWDIDFTWKPKKVTGDCLKIDYCNKALDNMLTHCEGYSLADAYKGGSYEDACGSFTYELKNYPLVKTTCAPTPNPFSSNYIYRDDAIDAINQFCTAHDGVKVNKGDAEIKELTFSINYAANCAGQGSFTVKKDDCVKWLMATVDNCDTNTVTYKHGGTSVEQNSCASFTLHPTWHDEYACYPDNVQFGYAGSNGISISQQVAQTAISQFCDRGGNNKYTLDPAKIPNPSSFIQDTCTTDGWAECPYYFKTNGDLVTKAGDIGDFQVKLSAQYVDRAGCPPKQKYEIHGDRCHNDMSKLLGGQPGTSCSPVNGQYKLGSYLEEGPHGCVLWTMSAVATHS